MIKLISESAKIIFSKDKLEKNKTSIETKKKETIKEDSKILVITKKFNLFLITTITKTIQEKSSDKTTAKEISKQTTNK
jgi:hypothetical protein